MIDKHKQSGLESVRVIVVTVKFPIGYCLSYMFILAMCTSLANGFKTQGIGIELSNFNQFNRSSQNNENKSAKLQYVAVLSYLKLWY